MSERKRFDLQFFADGGAAGGEGGGDGAAAGAEAADAGRSRLEELGVPPSKIRDRKPKSERPLPQGLKLAGGEPAGQTQTAEQPEAQRQDPGAEEQKAAEKAEEPKRLSFDEIKADPEYKAGIEAIVRARLREESGAKAELDRLAPTLKRLGERAGIQIDTRNMMALDLDGVDIQLRHDPDEVKELAAQLGTSQSVAREVLENRIRLEQEQAKSRRLNETMESQRRAEANRAHISKIEGELRRLKESRYPGIDVDRELADPVFQRLTAPGVNVPVEQALWAIHHDDYAQQAVAAGFNEGRRRMTAALQAANDRPTESGTGIAAGVPRFDYTKLNAAERAEFKEHIRQESAAGRKIYPTR